MGVPPLTAFHADESLRRDWFPSAAEGAFMAHAAVSPLPRPAAEALRRFADLGSRHQQECPALWREEREGREAAAALLGAGPDEIALLGPTSLGLNLVAAGLPWRSGDEVVFHADDYPANVYPWRSLEARGVVPVPLRPEAPGVITPDLVEKALTPRTRLVSLATCHYLSGYRIDEAAIGRLLADRGIAFCLDAIQTLGAFPIDLAHVDFLAADSHKWMLGPLGAGVFYVRRDRQEMLRPALTGSWNVQSPEFIAQERIEFMPGARRYEPGTLNLPGIMGMTASLRMLTAWGPAETSRQILAVREVLLEGLRELGFRLLTDATAPEAFADPDRRSGIISVVHPERDATALFRHLGGAGITASLRKTREGQSVLRFSPHAHTTEAEVERVLDTLEYDPNV